MASIFDKDPKTGLRGFETLLGSVTMPQLFNPTNKQLIDAAILRGSLELLKPKRPGENLASQASRSLDAMSIPGKTLSDYRASQLKSNQSGALGQSAIITNIKDDIEKGLLKVGSKSGIKDISAQFPVFYNNLVTNAITKYTSTGNYAAANAYSTKMFDELYTKIELNKDGNLQIKEGETVSPEMIDLITKANTAKVVQDSVDVQEKDID
tara:strand:+ start:184 stop:813 length:630 start_codon:yes stop_codon:yes gene_type:complete